MEDLTVHDSKSNVFVNRTDKPKAAMRSSGRRTLADISNIPQRPTTSNQSNNPHPSSATIREHIKQLQKEKAALMKLLSDKNKIIEENGAEGHKLRVTLQKIQDQNLQLGQSNNQMLAEIDSVKDRQKALEHDIGCKNGLIIAKNLELKNKTCQPDDDDKEKVTEAEINDDKHYISSRKQKSKSLVPPVEKVQDNDMGKKNKRLQTRRQSAIFKLDEPKPTKDNVDDDDDDDDDDKVKVNDSNSLSSFKEGKKGDFFEDYKAQEQRKTSLSRPLREAVKKVQSYKEIKVNMKMRRGE